ncbi:hypothetical protein ENBRE01_3049 [Enteropsectra breve]|nr:hypothetical protein ENBRE01_3049 [Enteropsectra breve]KAI5181977.1 hypothetical protein NEOKW01_2125 [Nematocida sp. AWRm80]KAI5181986.1 hypothetical protein NEOKW01_2132 [Nematocida sp. AWRm80]
MNSILAKLFKKKKVSKQTVLHLAVCCVLTWMLMGSVQGSSCFKPVYTSPADNSTYSTTIFYTSISNSSLARSEVSQVHGDIPARLFQSRTVYVHVTFSQEGHQKVFTQSIYTREKLSSEEAYLSLEQLYTSAPDTYRLLTNPAFNYPRPVIDTQVYKLVKHKYSTNVLLSCSQIGVPAVSEYATIISAFEKWAQCAGVCLFIELQSTDALSKALSPETVQALNANMPTISVVLDMLVLHNLDKESAISLASVFSHKVSSTVKSKQARIVVSNCGLASTAELPARLFNVRPIILVVTGTAPTKVCMAHAHTAKVHALDVAHLCYANTSGTVSSSNVFIPIPVENARISSQISTVYIRMEHLNYLEHAYKNTLETDVPISKVVITNLFLPAREHKSNRPVNKSVQPPSMSDNADIMCAPGCYVNSMPIDIVKYTHQHKTNYSFATLIEYMELHVYSRDQGMLGQKQYKQLLAFSAKLNSRHLFALHICIKQIPSEPVLISASPISTSAFDPSVASAKSDQCTSTSEVAATKKTDTCSCSTGATCIHARSAEAALHTPQTSIQPNSSQSMLIQTRKEYAYEKESIQNSDNNNSNSSNRDQRAKDSTTMYAPIVLNVSPKVTNNICPYTTVSLHTVPANSKSKTGKHIFGAAMTLVNIRTYGLSYIHDKQSQVIVVPTQLAARIYYDSLTDSYNSSTDSFQPVCGIISQLVRLDLHNKCSGKCNRYIYMLLDLPSTKALGTNSHPDTQTNIATDSPATNGQPINDSNILNSVSDNTSPNNAIEKKGLESRPIDMPPEYTADSVGDQYIAIDPVHGICCFSCLCSFRQAERRYTAIEQHKKKKYSQNSTLCLLQSKDGKEFSLSPFTDSALQLAAVFSKQAHEPYVLVRVQQSKTALTRFTSMIHSLVASLNTRMAVL